MQFHHKQHILNLNARRGSHTLQKVKALVTLEARDGSYLAGVFLIGRWKSTLHPLHEGGNNGAHGILLDQPNKCSRSVGQATAGTAPCRAHL
jgi:hypothetical protein